MTYSQHANEIFDRAVRDYHLSDCIDTPCANPYTPGTDDATLYAKCWVDAAQWHMEDEIRVPSLDPSAGMALKHRIDASNQLRTDMVEEIDSALRDKYKDVKVLADATINTESPAWAIDRLSILALKLWHMREQACREDASQQHRDTAAAKLAVLEEQRRDLSAAIDALLDDIAAGRKYMKVYRQMKLYNDPATNPAIARAKQR